MADIDQPPTNPSMYDGKFGKLTMAVLERLDYMSEHFPLTMSNIDVFEKGYTRYTDKINKVFQEYWESLPEPQRETAGGSVAKILDRTDANVRKMIAEVRRQGRIAR